MSITPTFQGEVMLAGWSETHNGGAKVTFWLQDADDLDAFKAMTVAKGKTAGQRLAIVAVEIGDDEQPVQQQEQKDEGYGHHYAVLYMRGWWHNPKVIAAFGVDASLPPDQRTDAIKQEIYIETGSESLTELEPHYFMQVCARLGIASTVPSEIREAA